MKNIDNIITVRELILNEAKRKEYQESFKRANNDPEIIELAEMGRVDYFGEIEKYENYDFIF